MKEKKASILDMVITVLFGLIFYVLLGLLILLCGYFLSFEACVNGMYYCGLKQVFFALLALLIPIVPACKLSYLIRWPLRTRKIKEVPISVKIVTFTSVMVFMILAVIFLPYLIY